MIDLDKLEHEIRTQWSGASTMTLDKDDVIALVRAVRAAEQLRKSNEPPHEGWGEAWFELRQALKPFRKETT